VLDVDKDERPASPKFQSVVGDIQFGQDGFIYTFNWGQLARKWDRSWNPVPFASTQQPSIPMPQRNSDKESFKAYGGELGPDTRCLGLDGRIYQFLSLQESGNARVRIWKSDGTLVKDGVIPFAPARHCTDIRVDRLGRLYVGVNGFPDGYVLNDREKAVEKRQPYRGTILRIILDGWLDKKDAHAASASTGVTINTFTTKFSIEEGKDGKERRGPGLWKGWGSLKLTATKLQYPRVDAVFTGMSWMNPGTECCCCVPVFDLDRFGRLYMPDPSLSRVVIFDANANQICEVADKIDEVEMALPMRVVALSEGFAFWNGKDAKIIKVQLGWSASETCQIQ
jgi:hypothetical protein